MYGTVADWAQTRRKLFREFRKEHLQMWLMMRRSDEMLWFLWVVLLRNDGLYPEQLHLTDQSLKNITVITTWLLLYIISGIFEVQQKWFSLQKKSMVHTFEIITVEVQVRNVMLQLHFVIKGFAFSFNFPSDWMLLFGDHQIFCCSAFVFSVSMFPKCPSPGCWTVASPSSWHYDSDLEMQPVTTCPIKVIVIEAKIM